MEKNEWYKQHVVDKYGKPFIGTIFPDKDFRFNKNIKEKENSYYKKGEREHKNNKSN